VRVIRPSALVPGRRRRPIAVAASTIAVGVLSALIAMQGPASTVVTGILAAVAALGLGVGGVWLTRAMNPGRAQTAADALVELLVPVFDDTYTLIVGPRLAIRDAARLDGLLVGPAGIRVLTVRSWEGRYRVRGRTWEFDARGRRGWIPCRTNPSHDAVALAAGVSRWATEAGLGDLAVRPVIAFPEQRSRVVLEEPADEVVTADNAPWWANSFGRGRRLDPTSAARVVEAVLDAAEPAPVAAPSPVADRRP
jgi:hypothetical protein